jgi:dipeptidyl aminopeptidase/acylaminoacyl peptidase
MASHYYRSTSFVSLLLLAALPRPGTTQVIDDKHFVFTRGTTLMMASVSLDTRTNTFRADTRTLLSGCPSGIIGTCGYLDPAVSPDGNQIAFVLRAESPSGESVGYGLWIRNLRTRRSLKVARTFGGIPTHLSWSPNGAKLLYSEAGGIKEISLCGTPFPATPRQITTGTSPSYSQDGRRIAFNRAGDIYAAFASGRSQSNITRTTRAEAFPRWSKPGTPGANRIVFLADTAGAREVHRIDLNGTGLFRATQSGTRGKSAPDVSNNGYWYVWEEGNYIWFRAWGGISGPAVESKLTFGETPVWGPKAVSVTTCP